MAFPATKRPFLAQILMRLGTIYMARRDGASSGGPEGLSMGGRACGRRTGAVRGYAKVPSMSRREQFLRAGHPEARWKRSGILSSLVMWRMSGPSAQSLRTLLPPGLRVLRVQIHTPVSGISTNRETNTGQAHGGDLHNLLLWWLALAMGRTSWLGTLIVGFDLDLILASARHWSAPKHPLYMFRTSP